MLKRLFLSAAVAATVAAIAGPAQAQRTIIVREAPPAVRQEAIPAARRGHVWQPGHWQWNGRRYVWAQGTWLRERRGYAYSEPRWKERDGRWEFERGNWRRGPNGDRDGDGVRNRNDARPNNPNRS